MRHVIKVIKWLLILILAVGLAAGIYAMVKLNQPATTTSQPRDFEIKRGENSGRITERLVEAGFVHNELLLELYLRFKQAEGQLQAGVYMLDSNMTIPEIVQILSQGKVKASGIRVTVVEGWTISEIASRLENLTLMQREEFTKVVGQSRAADPNGTFNKFTSEFSFLESKPKQYSLEGFLFPDTYLFKEGSSAEDLARKMLQNFDRKVTPEIREEIKKQNRSLYEALILASIVEREVGRNLKPGTVLTDADRQALKQERRLVASVFTNRLKIGMALNSDATVNYITGKGDRRALLEDLKIDSPYNTYKYRGLPPTPIANPSLDAILAVVHPAESDYLYFLTAPDGKAYFAKTLQEHAANRDKYLE